ncbi:MAG: 23S rRNA (adenine(2503)-C(2))-methyltransferase RlmN [bacterium]
MRGDILNYLPEDLAPYCGEAYRARQIWRWINKGILDFERMTDLPRELQRKLKSEFRAEFLRIAEKCVSPIDGTTKFLFELSDGEYIESVLLYEGKRATACLSTQVGCAYACAICATGMNGFIRSLEAGEMFNQLLTIQRETEDRISNVVLMGMGEPLANYDATLKAIRAINDFGIGMRRITLSTVGLIPQIRRLAREKLQITLAVSLHAATDSTRDRIAPINKKYPITPLMEACREYISLTGRKVTFEYVLLKDINDRPPDARSLAEILGGIRCNVNLIPYNETSWNFAPSDRAGEFADILRKRGIEVAVRKSRGGDILAGCGQLRRRGFEPDSHRYRRQLVQQNLREPAFDS